MDIKFGIVEVRHGDGSADTYVIYRRDNQGRYFYTSIGIWSAYLDAFTVQFKTKAEAQFILDELMLEKERYEQSH